MKNYFKRLVSFIKRLQYTYKLQKAIDGARLLFMAERAYVDMLAYIEFESQRENYRYFRVNFNKLPEFITIEIRRNPGLIGEAVETQTKEKVDECITKS